MDATHARAATGTTGVEGVPHDGLRLVVRRHEPAAATDDVPVLALHGFPQTHRCWDPVVERLLAAGRRVLVPGLRGYDPGARPLDRDAYALPRVVADVLAVADHDGARQVDLLGHDWGAVAAWGAAAASPDRVRSLVAVSVPHPRAFAAAITADADQQARSRYMDLFRLSGPAHRHRAEAVLLADGARRLRATYDPLPGDVAAPHLAAMTDRDALTGALGWYRGMDLEHLLAVPPVTVPTTFVWGAGDPAVGPVAAHGCAAHVEGPYRFVPLEGVSHWVPEQAPAEVAHAVLEPPRAPDPSS